MNCPDCQACVGSDGHEDDCPRRRFSKEERKQIAAFFRDEARGYDAARRADLQRLREENTDLRSQLAAAEAKLAEVTAERDAQRGEADKPVAWRWRYENPSTPWKLVEREFGWPSVAVGQPLYEHPAPVERPEARERVLVREWWEERGYDRHMTKRRAYRDGEPVVHVRRYRIEKGAKA